ncbi:MAG: hypothetical protein IPI55_03720 [Flavobacteriales bacterium]|nr:hypothetical protein [Flavobacteriales bacterium]
MRAVEGDRAVFASHLFIQAALHRSDFLGGLSAPWDVAMGTDEVVLRAFLIAQLLKNRSAGGAMRRGGFS